MAQIYYLKRINANIPKHKIRLLIHRHIHERKYNAMFFWNDK